MIKLGGKDVLPKAALAPIEEHEPHYGMPREEEKKEASEGQANGSQQRPNSGDLDLAGNECLEDCFNLDVQIHNELALKPAATEESKQEQEMPRLGS